MKSKPTDIVEKKRKTFNCCPDLQTYLQNVRPWSYPSFLYLRLITRPNQILLGNLNDFETWDIRDEDGTKVTRERTRMSPELFLGLQETVTDLKILALLLNRNKAGLLFFDFIKQLQIFLSNFWATFGNVFEQRFKNIFWAESVWSYRSQVMFILLYIEASGMWTPQVQMFFYN